MKRVLPTEKKIFDKLSEKFDDFISIFSPRITYRRKMFRFAQKLFSSHRGAEKNRLREAWLPGGRSADEDLLPELITLRERSRDLIRNDAHASGIIGTMTTNVIGSGIKPQSRIDKEGLDNINDDTIENFQKKAEHAWNIWIPFADSTERMNFYEIQQLIDRQILENGEVIILPLMLSDKNRPYNLALEIIEADRLDTPSDKKANKSIRSGVEIGDRGQPIAYWIRKNHPGEITVGSGYKTSNSENFTRIPAKNEFGRPNVLHLYWVLRPGQTRGMPFFTPVMTLFKDLADYLEAELVAARIAACFAIFIEKEEAYLAGYNNTDSINSQGQRLMELEPGMIKHLNQGEKISTFNPQRPGGSFAPFVELILRAMGTSLGLPYELVAKDFSKTTYSSARASLLEARRYFRCRQEWISRKLCQPTWEMLLEEAYLRGNLPVDNFYEKKLNWVKAKWIAPGWPWVDPYKEIKAYKEAVDSNISSLADVTGEQGDDWEEILEQRAREEKRKKELGLDQPKEPKKVDPEEEKIIEESEREDEKNANRRN